MSPFMKLLRSSGLFRFKLVQIFFPNETLRIEIEQNEPQAQRAFRQMMEHHKKRPPFKE